MRKRDVSKMKVGDKVVLKYGRGRGVITEILIEEDTSRVEGRYPMIRYQDPVLVSELWCTYLCIEYWTAYRRIL